MSARPDPRGCPQCEPFTVNLYTCKRPGCVNGPTQAPVAAKPSNTLPPLGSLIRLKNWGLVVQVIAVDHPTGRIKVGDPQSAQTAWITASREPWAPVSAP